MSNVRKVKVLLVTPDMAERWLNTNTHNRPLRNHLVQKYAAAMRNGEWKLTPEPIAFSKPYRDANGNDVKETLINGQHRLWAIVESNVPVEMTVWWGCEPDEFLVIDQNAPRTFGDVLATTRGDLTDHTLIASACTSFLQYGMSMNASVRQPHVDFVMRNFEKEILAVVAYKKKLRKMAGRPLLSGLVFAQIVNPAMADRIVDQLKDAVGFTDRDPIRALHMFLVEQMNPSTRSTPDVVHYKTCHALASRLKGDHIKQLKIAADGLAWMRDATRDRINPLVVEVHGSVPHNFYNPRILLRETPTASAA